MRSLYTSYIDTNMAYSASASVDTEISVMSGNRGSADGRWGTWRLGRLGTNVASCTALPKRNLPCFLVIWGVFQEGSLDGQSCA